MAARQREAAALRLVDVSTTAVDATTPRSGRSLILTREERARTRFRAALTDGHDALVLLPRGSILRPGTRLVADDGEFVDVVAAAEAVHRISPRADSRDPGFDLLRAAYHLGNRHVPVELGTGVLKIERDAVLRDLLLRLGMVVVSAFEPFDPEPGAYGGGHRHDSDVEGGATGEELSRNAHAMPTVASGPAS